MIKNTAFLIPIYPPHYQYIYNLINKLKVNDIKIDIYLVFSNNSDYNEFNMKTEILPIIMNETTQSKSIVVYKKFFGLKQLANTKYDYIISCDSEIDIIPNNFTNENINKKIEQIFYNKKIYAGDTTGIWVTKITKTSAELFPEKYEYLKDITKDFSLYFWWSDLPVYRRSDINEFFNMINYDNIIWEHFDYIIYQYYLILFHNFEIINTTPITDIKWSLEGLNTNNINILNKLLDIKYGFSWNSNIFYNNNKTFFESQGGFLIYHIDRE